MFDCCGDAGVVFSIYQVKQLFVLIGDKSRIGVDSDIVTTYKHYCQVEGGFPESSKTCVILHVVKLRPGEAVVVYSNFFSFYRVIIPGRDLAVAN